MKTYRVPPPLFLVVFLGTVADPFRGVTAPVIFNLDPAQSSITLSGNVLNNAFKEQGPGSLTASFSGTIAADVTGSTIQFIGGSAIDALTSGNWQPQTGGAAGSAPADYGVTAATPFATAFAAARNILVDVLSGPLPITNGTFGSSQLAFGFPTNATSGVDYRVTGLLSASGHKELVGLSTNRITTAATLTTSAAGETLTLPVDADFFLSLLSNKDTLLNLKGKLVATRSSIQGPVFNLIMVSNQTVTLRWQTIPGQKYQLESSTDLNAWIIEATNLIASMNTFAWSTNITHNFQFFRISY
ncbi:MAG: hypothetical protein ABI651_01440 [Verrucomicrobiota bacterium]